MFLCLFIWSLLRYRLPNSSEERLKVHQKAVEALGLACYAKGITLCLNSVHLKRKCWRTLVPCVPKAGWHFCSLHSLVFIRYAYLVPAPEIPISHIQSMGSCGLTVAQLTCDIVWSRNSDQRIRLHATVHHSSNIWSLSTDEQGRGRWMNCVATGGLESVTVNLPRVICRYKVDLPNKQAVQFRSVLVFVAL